MLLSFDRDWFQRVGNQQDGEHDGIGGSFSMKVATFKADLFEQSVQMGTGEGQTGTTDSR